MSEREPVSEDEIIGPKLRCVQCSNLSFDNYKYCRLCGTKRDLIIESYRSSEVTSDGNFISFISYFFISVAILAFYKFSAFSTDDAFNYFILLGLFAVIDIGYVIYNGKITIPLSLKNLRVKELLAMLFILFVSAVAVHYLAQFLNSNLFDDYVEEQFITWDNLWVALLLISIYPAVFEEVIYRGVLFYNIEKLSGKKTALIVSSLGFGLTHLSFVSLIWLIPLGLFFGYYRSKYNTLWYGIIGHFFYNTCVTVLDLIL